MKKTNPHPRPQAEQPMPRRRRRPVVDERFEAGKPLRDKIPRNAQAVWKRPSDPPDPVSVLQASDPGRLPELIPIRYGRMLQSSFAFFRGAAAVMAGDLAEMPQAAKLHRSAALGVCPLNCKDGGTVTNQVLECGYRTRDEARADVFHYIERFYNRGVGIRNWAISD
jgi:hypothetical protein